MKTILTGAALAMLSTMGYAADPPLAKEGLWTVHTVTTKNPGNQKSEENYSLCRNRPFDRAVQDSVKAIKSCTVIRNTFEGGKFYQDLHCLAGKTVVESRSTTTYQGDTSSHGETHATYTPQLNGLSEMTIVMDQKYTGRCPPGGIPGDKTYENGRMTRLGQN